MAHGRLADPDCTLGTDPRSDPRMVKALAEFGLDGILPEAQLSVDSPLEDRLAFAALNEEGVGAVLASFGQAVPDVEGVTTTTTTITSEDGNDVTLYVSRPDQAGALPAVVHLHGGGMAICSATDVGFARGREYLAATGLVVVGVEFRNSGGKLGPHPYPAGLNDCAAGARWVWANRSDLGVSHLIVSGESGGGNLTLTAQAPAMVATFCSLLSCPRCSPRACATSAGSRRLWADARVLEHRVAGVVAGNERDPRAAMASRAAEVQPVNRDRHVEEAFRPRTIGSHQIRMQQTVAEVT